MVNVGPFRLDLISDGFFEDDADTFVRHCVEREHKSDLSARAKRRIRVGFNSLLVRGGGKTVVVDPGTGDKPRDKLVAAYRMEWPRRFLPALSDLGVQKEAVDAVILTHLHWDHAGACTSFGEDGRLQPTFPNARYFVRRKEFDIAQSGGDGYLAEDFMPILDSGRLEMVVSDGEILPGFEVRWTGGHTPGHQIVKIGELNGSRAVFLSDLIPTSTQLPLDCGLSYDTNANELREAKARILEEAFNENHLLLFVHAPSARAGRLVKNLSGGYRLESVSV